MRTTTKYLNKKTDVPSVPDRACVRIAYTMFLLYIGINPVLKLIGINFNCDINTISYYLIFGLLAVYAARVLRNLEKINLSYHTFGLTLLILIILIEILSYPTIISYSNQSCYEYYMDFMKTNTTISLMFWIAGSNIEYIFDMLTEKSTRYITYFVYCMFVFMLLILKSSNNFLVAGETIFINTSEDKGYLYFGDTFVILTLLLLCICRSRTIKAVMSLNGVYWLYLIGSRTSFYYYILVLSIMAFKQYIKNLNNAKRAVFLLALSLLSALIAFNLQYILTLLGNNRMFILLVERNNDMSYMGRNFYLEEGINDVKQYWLWGKFLIEFDKFGVAGGYIHNILSYWVEYGILPFLFLLLLCILVLIKNTIFYLRSDDRTTDYVFYVSLYIILSLFTSRSYIHSFIWLAISASTFIAFKKAAVMKSRKDGRERDDGSKTKI